MGLIWRRCRLHGGRWSQQKALIARFATSEVAEDLQQSGFALGGRRLLGVRCAWRRGPAPGPDPEL